jgi:hypothetical protein
MAARLMLKAAASTPAACASSERMFEGVSEKVETEEQEEHR